MRQATLKIAFKTLEYVILIGLSVISIILSWEALVKFQSMDTNLKQRHQTIRRYPTVTICFNPKRDNYVYGEDFHFNIHDTVSNLLNDEEHKENILQDGLNEEHGVEMKEIITAYFGRCFRIIPTKYVTERSFDIAIGIKFQNAIPKSEVPSAEIYLTSEVNSIGINRAYWYEGHELTALVPPGVRKLFRLLEEEYNYRKDKSRCSVDQSWYDCFASFAASLPFNGCPTKCLAHSIHYNGSEKLKFCIPNTEEWHCSNKILRKLRKQLIENNTCPRSCTVRYYKGTTQDFAFDHNNTMAFNYYFAPPYVAIIHDEYLLFDFLGLISSVGGTLGIFIGFSFIAIISAFLSYLLSIINKYKRN